MRSGCYFYCTCFRLVSLTLILLITSAFGDEINFNPLSADAYHELEERIKQSDDALLESYKFLKSFVKQINTQYSLSLTMSEAANLIEKNIDQYNFPNETKVSLLRLIDFIQSFESNIVLSAAYINFLVPFEWLWDLIFEKHKMKSSQFIVEPLMQMGTAATEDQIAIGLVEIFAGALLCIIPHPVAQAAGGGMIADGIRRVFDDAAEIGEKNTAIQREQPKIAEHTTTERYRI